MILGRRPADPPWADALDVLRVEPTYGAQLDALLRLAARETRMPSRHLYLADPGGRRYHLERSQVDAGGSVAVDDEGGAEAMASAPQSELLREAGASPGIVATAVGPMMATPLVAGATEVGLLLVGPVSGPVPGGLVDATGRLAGPLAHALAGARDRELQRRAVEELTARLDAGHRLQGSALELDAFVALLLDLAVSATGSDGGFVAVVDDEGLPVVRAQAGLPAGLVDDLDLRPDTGVFDWSPSADGGALVLRDTTAVAAHGLRSLLAVPLVDAADRPLGLFALVSTGAGAGFDAESFDLLAAFAEQVRLMLGNASIFGQFVDSYLATMRGLAAALDARRPWTRGHHDAVTRVAAATATALGFEADVVAAVRVAAEVHDVGMAGVAGGVGAWASDLDHAMVAAELLEHLPLHPGVSPAVASHHEWYDGWGFPRGLRGEEIPIGGRILAVAEVAAELAAGDPARLPMPTPALVEELRRRAGSQFDPAVVEAAARVIPALDLESLVTEA